MVRFFSLPFLLLAIAALILPIYGWGKSDWSPVVNVASPWEPVVFKEETIELERFPSKIGVFDEKILNNKKLVLEACPTGAGSQGRAKVKDFPCEVVIQETQLLIDLRNSFVIQATNILNEDKNKLLNSRLQKFLGDFHKEQSICDPKSNFGVICGQHIAPSAIDSSLKGHKVNTHVILQRDKFYLQVKVPLN